MKLRNAFVTAKGNGVFFADKQWLLDTPKVIRQQAAFEVAKNFKAAWTNRARGNIDHFRMGFQSKRKSGYVLGIEKAVRFVPPPAGAAGKGSLVVLPETVGAVRFFEKPPPGSFAGGVPGAECKLQRDAFGDFWLLVPVTRAVRPPDPAVAAKVLAIDPGIRTPFCCYSPDGRVALEGREMKAAIEEVQRRVATTDRRIAAATSHDEKRRLRMHRRRLFRRYENVRDDAHWKLIRRMTAQNGTVLLPHLETSRLCGGLRAKSNREMFGISHYKFLERMRQKCEEMSATLVVADESYTTKTCGRCGTLNDRVGTSEVFACVDAACGLRCHRDLHAARNIYLRWACASAAAAPAPSAKAAGAKRRRHE